MGLANFLLLLERVLSFIYVGKEINLYLKQV